MTKKTWAIPVDSEGVVVFPEELLKTMRWNAGTVLAWNYLPDGSIKLSKVTETAPNITLPESKS